MRHGGKALATWNRRTRPCVSKSKLQQVIPAPRTRRIIPLLSLSCLVCGSVPCTSVGVIYWLLRLWQAGKLGSCRSLVCSVWSSWSLHIVTRVACADCFGRHALGTSTRVSTSYVFLFARNYRVLCTHYRPCCQMVFSCVNSNIARGCRLVDSNYCMSAMS